MRLFESRASRRRVIATDVLVFVWIVLWIVVGIRVGQDLHEIRNLSETVNEAAGALHQTSDALSLAGDVPFVGHRIDELATQIDATATSAQNNATTARDAVTRLSYLLGAAIIILPSVPLLALYLPYRIERRREARAIRQALEETPHPDLLLRYLAERALLDLPYQRLREVSAAPWDDVANGRYEPLAQAELDRLGFGDRPWLERVLVYKQR